MMRRAGLPAWMLALSIALTSGPAMAQQAEVPAQMGGNGPLATRTQPSIQGLFAKGTVTGSELVAELIALRTLMASKRSAQAVGALLGSAEPAGARGFDPQGELIKLALKGAEEAVKPYVAAVGFGALDLHLRTMIDDPNLLAAESIKLPSPKDMNPAQAQRVINMAAIVVATRVTGKMLAKAQADFANVETDYSQLIASREAVAKLLYDVLLKAGPAAGAAGPELEGLYTEEDLAYLRANVTRMIVADFAADLGAQNLALPLDFWELQSLVRNLSCDRAVFIIDTCHAGGAASKLQTVQVSANGVAAGPAPAGPNGASMAKLGDPHKHLAIITASRADEVSGDTANGGVFTLTFLDGLQRTKGAEPLGRVVAQHVAPTVVQFSRENCKRQGPGCRFPQQTPELHHTGRGDQIVL